MSMDTNPAKFTAARAMGVTDCVDPTRVQGAIQHVLSLLALLVQKYKYWHVARRRACKERSNRYEFYLLY